MKRESILETLQNKYLSKEIEVCILNNGYGTIMSSYNDKINKNIQTLVNVIVERVDVDYDYDGHTFRLHFTYNNNKHFIDLENE